MESNRGFALAAAMAILALLSVLGAAAIQSSTLEVQISARDRDARVALYIAESALEEARYYASRGWGKISGPTSTAVPNRETVTVVTPLPPGLSWDTDRYAGFSLVDETGASLPVTANSFAADPALTLDTASGSPAQGRFAIVRRIISATWDGATLQVDDWTDLSSADAWRGWTLWNGAGAFRVLGSTNDPATSKVQLQLASDPGPVPSEGFLLALNPWLAALAAGNAPLGGGTGSWDRSFQDESGNSLGFASVTARETSPGKYELTSLGLVQPSRRTVSLMIHRAGRPDQRASDWKVDGGI